MDNSEEIEYHVGEAKTPRVVTRHGLFPSGLSRSKAANIFGGVWVALLVGSIGLVLSRPRPWELRLGGVWAVAGIPMTIGLSCGMVLMIVTGTRGSNRNSKVGRTIGIVMSVLMVPMIPLIAYAVPAAALGGVDWPIDVWKDLYGDTAVVEGPVEDRRQSSSTDDDGNVSYEYFITVQGIEFRVDGGDYNALGTDSIASVVYYPNTGLTAKVRY